jgi:hypothetical protein
MFGAPSIVTFVENLCPVSRCPEAAFGQEDHLIFNISLAMVPIPIVTSATLLTYRA